MTDISDNLKELAGFMDPEVSRDDIELLNEAVAEIEALKAEVARLRGVIETALSVESLASTRKYGDSEWQLLNMKGILRGNH